MFVSLIVIVAVSIILHRVKKKKIRSNREVLKNHKDVQKCVEGTCKLELFNIQKKKKRLQKCERKQC